MKGRVIVLDKPKDRPSKAALIVDGRLEDLRLDPPTDDQAPDPGEIYWAKVDRTAGPGVFVKLTPSAQGYLRDTKGLKPGQGVLVQVSSYADPGKATPVTTKLLYKARRVIHSPGAPGINVSRQIKDPDVRDRLTEIVKSWTPSADIDETVRERLIALHQDGGFILRTLAAKADAPAIVDDIMVCLGARSLVEATSTLAPGTSPADRQLATREAMREWTAGEAEMIAVTNSFYAELKDPIVASRHGLERSDSITPGDGDPFDHFGVWDEIERLRAARADLPSGAWMAIEATRAMVTVDVNTGDQFSQGAGMTANIEAVRDLPRQLRLRGLGGQVIIDFAPMKKMHRRKIEEELKRAFGRDTIATTLAGWTPLGNFELQRKRERRPLSELL